MLSGTDWQMSLLLSWTLSLSTVLEQITMISLTLKIQMFSIMTQRKRNDCVSRYKVKKTLVSWLLLHKMRLDKKKSDLYFLFESLHLTPYLNQLKPNVSWDVKHLWSRDWRAVCGAGMWLLLKFTWQSRGTAQLHEITGCYANTLCNFGAPEE